MASNNGSTNTNTSGDSNVGFDFTQKTGSDCISDKNMAEITRRLIGAVDSDGDSCCVFAPDPPNNTKKLWIETTDNGQIIGTIKRYDSESGQWVDDHLECGDCEEEGGDALYPRFWSEEQETTELTDTELTYNHNFGTLSYTYNFYWLDVPKNDTRWWETEKNENYVKVTIRDGQVKDSGGAPMPNRMEVLEVLVDPGP
jgi:hypothetical protein